jgi:hypothetical protein
MHSCVNASPPARRPVPSKRVRQRRLNAVRAKVAKGEPLSQYESVVAALLSRGKISLADVAKATGVSLRTIENIAGGYVSDPLASSCEQIAGFFRARKKSFS